ncbi:glycosyltransferase family 4 protein [Candidatus Berkelbacteria bacterium]|nr:glycosyltransferase family 4 protein [Candidatus Berkelbacteria bacterium]
MKILELVHRFPPSIGGSQSTAAHIAWTLGELGHEVTVVTTTSLNQFDVFGWTARGWIRRSTYPAQLENEERSKVRVLRFPPRFQFYTGMWTPALYAWVRKHKEDFDLIHAHGYTFFEPLYPLLPQRARRPKLVLSGYDLTQPHQSLAARLALNLHDRTLGRHMLNSYDALIALTDANVEEYLALGAKREKIHVIPVGVDSAQFAGNSAARRADQLELLFIGRLVEYKGAQYAIQALKKILKKRPKARLTIVGEDQGYQSTLEVQVSKEKLGQAVTFAGKVSDEMLVKYCQSAHFLVFPSLNEGFGIVVLQAIAGGCYPILADRKSLRYVLRDIGGHPINMDQPEQIGASIAQAILTLSEKQRVQEVRKMQKLVREHYAWQPIAQLLLRVADLL